MKPGFSIRINTIKVTKRDFIDKLIRAQIPYQHVAWCEYAVWLETDKNDFFDSDFVKNGWCYVQNLSSLLPGIILDPKPGENVLDLCAAPGGKTTHLAQLMNNQGQIIANDASRNRIYKLENILGNYGVTNVETRQGNGQDMWWQSGGQYQDYFDKILVDAPCSMNQDLKGKVLKSLARRQQFILRSALTCLKSGGNLVYATCTSNEIEDENVIEKILKIVEGIEIEKIFLPSELQKFITREGFVKIEDDSTFDPFFIARLTKL